MKLKTNTESRAVRLEDGHEARPSAGQAGSTESSAEDQRNHPLPKDRRFIALIGMRFDRLVVTGYAGRSETKNHMWWCKCDCGKTVNARGGNLKNGHSRSCGCRSVEVSRTTNLTHGMTRSLTHSSWCKMHYRCSRTDNTNYGGRGISVCARWSGRDGFVNFLADMGKRQSQRRTLDRIDVNGNYEPSNCRWATQKEQCNNTRMNHCLTFNGITMNITQWSEKLGWHKSKIHNRLRRGWSTERIFTTL